MTRCEWCGADLPPRKPGPGRPRRFCSKACKNATYREADRHGAIAATVGAVPLDAVRALTVEAVEATLAGAAPSDPVGQLARAVSETEALAVEYGRLARSTPPNLGARSAEMSEHLRAGLTRLFPREDT